jgi:hypothetical protein
MVTILKQTEFVWRGLGLHLGRGKAPVLNLSLTRPIRTSTASDT